MHLRGVAPKLELIRWRLHDVVDGAGELDDVVAARQVTVRREFLDWYAGRGLQMLLLGVHLLNLFDLGGLPLSV